MELEFRTPQTMIPNVISEHGEEITDLFINWIICIHKRYWGVELVTYATKASGFANGKKIDEYKVVSKIQPPGIKLEWVSVNTKAKKILVL